METTEPYFDPNTGWYIFSLNRPGLLASPEMGSDIYIWDRRLGLSQQLAEWLEEQQIIYTLDIQHVWSSEPSYILIRDVDSAILFKLTWL